MNRRDGQRALPVVPDVHYFAVGSRDEMIMPSVPFHLCPGCAPVAKTHDRSVKAPQIPPAYAGVHGDGGHEVGIERMPVDVCDGARMGVERLEERPWRCEVPHEQLLGRGGEDEVGRGWMWRPLDTALHERAALDPRLAPSCVPTHSAICHAPPCGTNLGAVLRFARSRMYKPFLDARQTSLLQGLMEMEPTGWFTLIVAPSLNGSSPCGRTAGESALEGGGGRGCSAVSGDGWNSPDDADDRREEVSAGEGGRGTLAASIGGPVVVVMMMMDGG